MGQDFVGLRKAPEAYWPSLSKTLGDTSRQEGPEGQGLGREFWMQVQVYNMAS